MEDDFEGALAALDAAVERAPAYSWAYFQRAKVHRKFNRNDLASADTEMYRHLMLGLE